MPSINVVDASGVQQTVQTLPSVGQAAMAASLPVVMASDWLPRATQTASIPSAGSVTPTVDLNNTTLLGFISPSAWTTAALNIEVSVDNTNWITAGVYDYTGTPTASYSAIVASSAYAVDNMSLLPYRYVRLRSGTAASPVNQAAQRDFVLITRSLI